MAVANPPCCLRNLDIYRYLVKSHRSPGLALTQRRSCRSRLLATRQIRPFAVGGSPPIRPLITNPRCWSRIEDPSRLSHQRPCGQESYPL